MRLGSEAQLGTSIATFSADGAGSFMLKESQPENNAQCAHSPGPMAGASAPGILSWSLSHHGCQHRKSLLCFQEKAACPPCPQRRLEP